MSTRAGFTGYVKCDETDELILMLYVQQRRLLVSDRIPEVMRSPYIDRR